MAGTTETGTVSYDSYPDDIKTYISHVTAKHPLIRRIFFIARQGPMLLGVACLITALVLYLNNDTATAIGMIYIALLAFATGLFMRWLIGRWLGEIGRALADHPGPNLGSHHLTVTPTGLTDEADGKRRAVNGTDIDYIGMDDEFLYVSVRRGGDAKLFGVFGRGLWLDAPDTSPFIIPRRAFAGDSEFRNFISALTRLKSGA